MKKMYTLLDFGIKDPEGAVAEPPKVAYEKTDKGYMLYTIDENALRLLPEVGFIYMPSNQYFHAQVKVMPKSNSICFYKNEIVPPSIFKKNHIAKIYDKYKKAVAVYEKMAIEINKLEDGLTKEVILSGMKLKPGAPEDSQVFLEKVSTRLHNKQAIHKSYDLDNIQKISEKYPNFKKAIRKKVIYTVDRSLLEKLIAELPPAIARKIINIETISSFTELEIKNADCNHCGGKKLKSGHCKRCGIK